MREIKFRFWDSNVGAFDTTIGGYVLQGVDLSSCLPGGYTVMQYTGLRDKNGVEIYEGDVLHWQTVHDDPEIVAMNNGNVLVEWEYGMWVVQNAPRNGLWKCVDDMETENSETYQVIGNIYENPELLGADR